MQFQIPLVSEHEPSFLFPILPPLLVFSPGTISLSPDLYLPVFSLALLTLVGLFLQELGFLLQFLVNVKHKKQQEQVVIKKVLVLSTALLCQCP